MRSSVSSDASSGSRVRSKAGIYFSRSKARQPRSLAVLWRPEGALSCNSRMSGRRSRGKGHPGWGNGGRGAVSDRCEGPARIGALEGGRTVSHPVQRRRKADDDGGLALTGPVRTAGPWTTSGPTPTRRRGIPSAQPTWADGWPNVSRQRQWHHATTSPTAVRRLAPPGGGRTRPARPKSRRESSPGSKGRYAL
jgi:hypothetical protein